MEPKPLWCLEVVCACNLTISNCLFCSKADPTIRGQLQDLVNEVME